jgi:hypothetical protein
MHLTRLLTELAGGFLLQSSGLVAQTAQGLLDRALPAIQPVRDALQLALRLTLQIRDQARGVDLEVLELTSLLC